MNANELAVYLEDITDWEESPYRQAATMLRQQQAEIERLIGLKPITYGMLTFCKNCGEQNPYQAKTLTDEEINKIYLEKYDGHMGFLSPDEVRDFARAILRKAQEK